MLREKMKILAAVDGSEQSLDAVRYLAEFASPENTEATAFHVLKGMPRNFRDLEHAAGFTGYDRLSRAWEDRQGSEIREFMERVKEIFYDADYTSDNFRIKIRAQTEGPARDILREAAAGFYDAVVVGGTGASRLKDIVLGTAADKLMGNLHHIPICVVFGRPSPEGIVLALDSSEGAGRAASFLAALAGSKPRKVFLFHAVEHLEFPREIPEAEDLLKAARKTMEEEARAVMTPIFQDVKRTLVKAGTPEADIALTIRTGVHSRAWAIIDEAAASGAGTIILGRRGLSKVEQFLMGRVGAKVVRLAKNQAVWVVN